MAASEKQVAFANRLMDEVVAHFGAESSQPLADLLTNGTWENISEMEGWQVGGVIDVLLTIKKVNGIEDQERRGISNPEAEASQKQKDFILSLDSSLTEDDVASLTRQEASDKIEELRKK